MANKKFLIINLFLSIMIVLITIVYLLFNNYLHVSYDPFNDPREYERLKGTKLADNEIPIEILYKTETAIDEYQQLLKARGIDNLEIAKIVSLLYTEGNYHLKYVVVDTKINKIISTIYFRYSKDSTLKSITAEYRYFSESDFLIYNESLINIKTFNISEKDKEDIKIKSKNNLASSWKIGSKYKYDYYKKEQTENVYGGIDDMKVFNIIF